jgi:hypothetical protein
MRDVIPAEYADLLASTALAHVATIGPHGEPRVALSTVDPANAYRYLEVRGTVERIEPAPDRAFIDAMARKYLGQDCYPFGKPGDE